MARWLLDTSAYSRRGIAIVGESLRRRIDDGDELCLSAPTLLELLREPRGPDVAAAYAALTDAFDVVPLSPETGALAAASMVDLATVTPEAHRMPIADLLTAALATERGIGVIHLDKDFDQLAATETMHFTAERACAAEQLASVHQTSAASRQRQLRRTLHQTLSHLPVADAERLLTRFIAEAKQAGDPQ